MSLWEYEGKNVKIICKDNQELIGRCIRYTDELDNEEAVASIDIRTEAGHIIEIMEDEIKSIKEV